MTLSAISMATVRLREVAGGLLTAMMVRHRTARADTRGPGDGVLALPLFAALPCPRARWNALRAAQRAPEQPLVPLNLVGVPAPRVGSFIPARPLPALASFRNP